MSAAKRGSETVPGAVDTKSTRRAFVPFKQIDVTRAIRGVQAAGLGPRRVEIDREGGRIVVDCQEATDAEPSKPFDKWKAKRHARPA